MKYKIKIEVLKVIEVDINVKKRCQCEEVEARRQALNVIAAQHPGCHLDICELRAVAV